MRFSDKIRITHRQLLSHLTYVPESGAFIRLAPSQGKGKQGEECGWIDEYGYRRIFILGRSYAAGQLAWFYMTGEWPENEVDHEDKNPGNNKWANLREATPSQNKANKGLYKSNSSGYKGVNFFKMGKSGYGLWRARIGVAGKRVSLGLFNTPEEAHNAYALAALKYHGEFARAK